MTEPIEISITPPRPQLHVVDLWAWIELIYFLVTHEVVAFQVIDPGERGTVRGDHLGIWSGPVRPLFRRASSREGPT